MGSRGFFTKNQRRWKDTYCKLYTVRVWRFDKTVIYVVVVDILLVLAIC